MSDYRVVTEYPHPQDRVWRALTDPSVIPRWTSEGRGGKPVGFAPEVGTEFQYVARPMPGWDGVVQCKVLEVQPPSLLSYSWLGGKDDDLTTVTCRLEPTSAGTRLIWEHTGFSGIGGFLMAKLLASVRRKMLTKGLPEALDELAAQALGAEEVIR